LAGNLLEPHPLAGLFPLHLPAGRECSKRDQYLIDPAVDLAGAGIGEPTLSVFISRPARDLDRHLTGWREIIIGNGWPFIRIVPVIAVAGVPTIAPPCLLFRGYME